MVELEVELESWSSSWSWSSSPGMVELEVELESWSWSWSSSPGMVELEVELEFELEFEFEFWHGRVLAWLNTHPMLIEPKITLIPSGFSGYIWLDTKIVFKEKYIIGPGHNINSSVGSGV